MTATVWQESVTKRTRFVATGLGLFRSSSGESIATGDVAWSSSYSGERGNEARRCECTTICQHKPLHQHILEDLDGSSISVCPPDFSKSSSSRYCPIHARDFSDCIVQHTKWPSHCHTRRNVLKVFLREVLEGRWGTPVQNSSKEKSGVSRYDKPPTLDGSKKHNACKGKEKIDGFVDHINGRVLLKQYGGDRMREGYDYQETRKGSGERFGLESLDGRKERSRPSIYFTDSDINGPDSAVEGTALHDLAASPMVLEDTVGLVEITDKVDIEDGGTTTMVKAYDANVPVLSLSVGEVPREGKEKFSTQHIMEDSETRRCSGTEISQSKRLWSDSGKDPLDKLGADLMLKIFSFLDACSLARCGSVSKGWQLWAYDDSLWIPQCRNLWEEKAHLPCSALQEGLPKVAAFSISVKDSKRTKITRNDLCDHSWEFRFKSVSPEYWLNLDPSWRGEPPMQRFFHWDGSQTAGPNDSMWGGHECRYYILDMPSSCQDSGTYVRINHWPKMIVSRTRTWGWELQNEIYIYNSIPDPWKTGGTGPMFVK